VVYDCNIGANNRFKNKKRMNWDNFPMNENGVNNYMERNLSIYLKVK
jgi:hypothetical protein